MSLASTRVGLKHRCTIQRRTRVSDGGGGATYTWSTTASDVPCRAWADAASIRTLGDKLVEVEGRQMIVPISTDIKPEDRILSITFRGATYMAGPLDISTVIRREDHLGVVFQEISG